MHKTKFKFTIELGKYERRQFQGGTLALSVLTTSDILGIFSYQLQAFDRYFQYMF